MSRRSSTNVLTISSMCVCGVEAIPDREAASQQSCPCCRENMPNRGHTERVFSTDCQPCGVTFWLVTGRLVLRRNFLPLPTAMLLFLTSYIRLRGKFHPTALVSSQSDASGVNVAVPIRMRLRPGPYMQKALYPQLKCKCLWEGNTAALLLQHL